MRHHAQSWAARDRDGACLGRSERSVAMLDRGHSSVSVRGAMLPQRSAKRCQDTEGTTAPSKRVCRGMAGDTLPYGVLYECARAVHCLAPDARPRTLSRLEELVEAVLAGRYAIDASIAFVHLVTNGLIRITTTASADSLVAVAPAIRAHTNWQVNIGAGIYPSDHTNGIRVAPEFLALMNLLREWLREDAIANEVPQEVFFHQLQARCILPPFRCTARDVVAHLTATTLVVAAADGTILHDHLASFLHDKVHFRSQLVNTELFG